MTVTDSTFTGNTAAGGGAIDNTHYSGGQGGLVTVSGSTFTDNTVTGGGGAIGSGRVSTWLGDSRVTGQLGGGAIDSG